MAPSTDSGDVPRNRSVALSEEEDDAYCLTAILNEWSKQDVRTMYDRGDLTAYLDEKIASSRPPGRHYAKWPHECYTYLVESYVYWRRNVELINLGECRVNAYRDLYEWMYAQQTPKVTTLSKLSRGW